MDPETGLNAVRNVGIRDGKIIRISTAVHLPCAGCQGITRSTLVRDRCFAVKHYAWQPRRS
jgi:hypothetical protein